MKKNFFTLAMAAACVAVGMSSCSNDDENVAMSGTRALERVAVGINTMSDSRSGIRETQFAGTESIGLYLYAGANFGDAYNIGLTGNLREPLNIEYKRNAESNWWVAPVESAIILSSKDGKLYGYYPWSADNNADNGSAIKINVADDQGSGQSNGTADVAEQADYMWATVTPGAINNATASVDIKMSHALSMLSFQFVRDTYPGEGKISSIVIKNANGVESFLVGDATMHINGGAIDNTNSEAGQIKVTPTDTDLMDVTDPNKVPHMLVYPTAANLVEGAWNFVITMDGKEFTLPVPVKDTNDRAYKLEAGKNYVYTFTLKGHGFGADDETGRDDIAKVEITAWVDTPVTGGDLVNPDNNNH